MDPVASERTALRSRSLLLLASLTFLIFLPTLGASDSIARFVVRIVFAAASFIFLLVIAIIWLGCCAPTRDRPRDGCQPLNPLLPGYAALPLAATAVDALAPRFLHLLIMGVNAVALAYAFRENYMFEQNHIGYVPGGAGRDEEAVLFTSEETPIVAGASSPTEAAPPYDARPAK